MLQTVIFSASDAPGLYPFSVNKPAGLIPVLNKTLLEYNMEQLAPFTSEWIVIVGHDEPLITSALGSTIKKKPVKFLKLDEPWNWTDVLRAIRPYITSHFLLTGTELVLDREDLKNIISYSPAMLSFENGQPSKEASRISYVDEEHSLEVVNPDGFRPACFFFTHSVLKLLSGFKGPFNKFLYQYLLEHKARIILSGRCLPLCYGWDILNAHEKLLQSKQTRIRGTVEPGVTLKGAVVIGKGTLVKTGTYIEGPVIIGDNGVIGPNSYIRGATCIGNECRIGQSVEIKNCVIGHDVRISHLSYFGDSIIGNRVNIGAGNISANLRHDGSKIISWLNGEKIETGRKKLGVMIGDEVHTGIHNSFYPGRKLWPHVETLPGAIIDKDVMH